MDLAVGLDGGSSGPAGADGAPCRGHRASGCFLAPNGTHGLLRRLAAWRGCAAGGPCMEAYADDLADSSRQMRRPPGAGSGAFVATWMSLVGPVPHPRGGHGHGGGPLASLECPPDRDPATGHVGVPLVSPTPGIQRGGRMVARGVPPLVRPAPSPLAPAMFMLLWRMATHFLYLCSWWCWSFPDGLRRTGRGNRSAVPNFEACPTRRSPPDSAPSRCMPGVEPDPSTGAIMTPVYMSSTYVQDGIGQHKGI